ncbi:MAG TPA: hypothetical protein VFO84_10190 [Dehalococcoidia bacterium]|nr:hypothetical protein [Dehalococcoidia bacterium]
MGCLARIAILSAAVYFVRQLLAGRRSRSEDEEPEDQPPVL